MIFDYFPHNWLGVLEVESQWMSTIASASKTDDEERCALVERPSRQVKAKWSGLTRADAQRLNFALLRAGQDEIAVPLYSDQAETTAASSGTTINCPTATRRFFVGFDVVIVNGQTGTWEQATVSAMTSSTITTSGALGATYPTGSLVFPLVDCLVSLDGSMNFVNHQVGEADVEWLEVTDSRTLPAAAADTLPTGVDEIEFPTGTTLPIFPSEIQWAEPVRLQAQRAGERYTRGTGTVVYKRGTRPLMGIQLEVLATDRDEAWQQIQFFDYCRGSVLPFWLLAPVLTLEAVAFNVGYIDVEQIGNLADLEEFLRQVAVIADDGSFQLATVSTILEVGDIWRISFVDALPSVAGAARALPAYLVRFASDAQTEEWVTTECCRFQVQVTEVAGLEETVETPLESIE